MCRKYFFCKQPLYLESNKFWNTGCGLRKTHLFARGKVGNGGTKMASLIIKRTLYLLLVVCGAVAYTATLDPFPQTQSYHVFADSLELWSIPNALNVLSNFVFVVVGIAGWARLRNRFESPTIHIWRFMFLSVIFVGMGSSWYHWNPNNNSLFWDRLPMSIGFAAMIAGIFADRINCRTGCALCLPLILFSTGTVIYWIYTEQIGKGDLRPYLLLQYLSMVLIPLVLVLFPESSGSSRPYWVLWLFYVIAKLCELQDRQIYEITGHLLSGHTLKHFAAATGLWFFRPYPQRFSQSGPRCKGPLILLLLCFILYSPAASQAATHTELEEARFLMHAMAMNVAAAPGRGSELLQEALRQQENWQSASYVIEKGTVEAEILVSWRKNSDGSSDYWLAVAGSDSLNDWILDFDVAKVNFAKQNNLSAPYTDMGLHRGFNRHAQAILDLPIRTPIGTNETLANFLLRNPNQKIVLAGHCLGGSAVVVVSARLVSLGVNPEQIRVVTFGAPAVGDKAFTQYFEKIIDMTRVVTTGDTFSRLPPRPMFPYLQWGRLIRWEMPKLPSYERHYKKHQLDFALKKYLDLKLASDQSVGPSTNGRVYIAAIQNELPSKWGGDDFPYMKMLLYDTYRDLFGRFVANSSNNASFSQFEQLRSQAAEAGCEYLLFASIWGQRHEDDTVPYTLITLDQALYRISDGSLVYAASYQDGARLFAPLEAVWMAATIMNTDASLWLERKAQ